MAYVKTLAGDTDNYVCMRAVAEMKTPMSVLQQVVEENLDSACKLEEFASAHPGLQHIFDSFLWVSTLIMLYLSSSIVQRLIKWSLAGLCRISLQREEISYGRPSVPIDLVLLTEDHCWMLIRLLSICLTNGIGPGPSTCPLNMIYWV